jgi:hypothetical protein
MGIGSRGGQCRSASAAGRYPGIAQDRRERAAQEECQRREAEYSANLPDWQKIEEQRAEAERKREKERALTALGITEDQLAALLKAAKK